MNTVKHNNYERKIMSYNFSWYEFFLGFTISIFLTFCIAIFINTILYQTSVLPYDVNNDRIFDQKDIDMTCSFVLLEKLPTRSQFIRADANNDGKINSTDLTIMSRLLES